MTDRMIEVKKEDFVPGIGFITYTWRNRDLPAFLASNIVKESMLLAYQSICSVYTWEIAKGLYEKLF